MTLKSSNHVLEKHITLKVKLTDYEKKINVFQDLLNTSDIQVSDWKIVELWTAIKNILIDFLFPWLLKKMIRSLSMFLRFRKDLKGKKWKIITTWLKMFCFINSWFVLFEKLRHSRLNLEIVARTYFRCRPVLILWGRYERRNALEI